MKTMITHTAMSYYLTVTDLISQIDWRDVFQEDVDIDDIHRLVLSAESLANRGRREVHRRLASRREKALPASVAAPDPAEPSTWHLAESDQPIKTPQPIQETEILCAHLPERWLPELRLRLHGYDGRDEPVITLRVNTEGGGAYLTLSTQGKIPFDPGELDFLPSVGNALCKFVDALYPYGV